MSPTITISYTSLIEQFNVLAHNINHKTPTKLPVYLALASLQRVTWKAGECG